MRVTREGNVNRLAYKTALLPLIVLAAGCSSVAHSMQIVKPLSEALEPGATLGISLVAQDPDFDPDAMMALEQQLLPALQAAGVVGSVVGGGASLTLKFTVNEYESTGKFGRAMWGVLAGPAIVVGSIELSSQEGDLLSTGVSSANSAGFGIFSGTDTETHQRTVENIVSFLQQSAPARAGGGEPLPVSERDRESSPDPEPARDDEPPPRDVKEDAPPVDGNAAPCRICGVPRGDVVPCPSCEMD
jgi:hypothetical protein